MFRFNHHHQEACYLSFDKVTVTNSNFIKAQIARSLMMVIKPKHVGAFFNVNFNISFKAKLLCISW